MSVRAIFNAELAAKVLTTILLHRYGYGCDTVSSRYVEQVACHPGSRSICLPNFYLPLLHVQASIPFTSLIVLSAATMQHIPRLLPPLLSPPPHTCEPFFFTHHRWNSYNFSQSSRALVSRPFPILSTSMHLG